MPAEFERKLRLGGMRKGLKGKRLDVYIYGTMNNMGYMHGNKPTKKSLSFKRK